MNIFIIKFVISIIDLVTVGIRLSIIDLVTVGIRVKVAREA